MKEKKNRKLTTNSSFVSDKPKKNLPAVRVLELNNLIVEKILDGYARKEIIALLETEHPGLLLKEYEELYVRGHKYFRERVVDVDDLRDVITIHLGLYEDIYKKFNELDVQEGKRKSMFQKEKLLGFHKETNILEINQDNTIIETSPYNLERLSKEEKKRLEGLIGKATKQKIDRERKIYR